VIAVKGEMIITSESVKLEASHEYLKMHFSWRGLLSSFNLVLFFSEVRDCKLKT
jgi:hypothetical protein